MSDMNTAALEIHLRLQEMIEARASEINERARELAAEAIQDPEQLAKILNDKELAHDLAGIVQNIERARNEYARFVPLGQGWVLAGVLARLGKIERQLLAWMEQADHIQDRAAEEVIRG